jgi:two-component system, sensor histidine kinase and response regulator
MIPPSANHRISRIDYLTAQETLNEKDRAEIRSLLQQAEKEWELTEFKYNRAMKDRHVLSSLLTKTSEDLKQSLEAEKKFISSMSHEIRTPLNSIIGFIDLMKTTNLTDEQKGYLNNASVSADHLMSLISNILDVSKIEAGQLEAHEEEFSLEDILMDCLVIISTRVKKGVELLHDLPEFDHFVIGDPVRIKQIFVNLLGNAAKFTNQGHIRLSLSKCEVFNSDKMRIAVCVEDTGIGIPETHISRIFSPFIQVHESISGGTGLGLYLSNSLAKLMGGDIEVKSTYGTGTNFTVHLVLKRGSVKENKFTFNNMTIIIVEDDEKLRLDLYLKLWMRGATVLTPEFKKPTDIINFCTSAGTTANLMVLNLDIFKDLSLGLATLLKDAMPEMSILGVTAQGSSISSHATDVLLRKPFTYYKLAEIMSGLCSRSKSLPTTSGLGGMRVLLVEDMDMNLLLAESMFDTYFHLRVDVARDGLEAVEKTVDGAYDIIFMDIQMPHMDGITATKKIREKGVKTPISGMTADAFSDSMDRAMKAGMDDYIIKPIKKEQIERVLLRFAPGRERHIIWPDCTR